MDGLSAAGGILAIAAAGLQTSVKLVSFAHHVGNGPERIRYIATDVSLTAGILQQLGELMKQSPGEDERFTVFSEGGLVSTQTSANTCQDIFKALEEALKPASQQIRTNRVWAGEKVVLSKTEALKWPFLQPKFEALRTELSNARATLMLILQVASLAYTRKLTQNKNPVATNQGEQDDLVSTIIALQRLQTEEVPDQENRVDCRIDNRSREAFPTTRGSSAQPPAESPRPFPTLRSTSRLEGGHSSLRRKYLDANPGMAANNAEGGPPKKIVTQALHDKSHETNFEDENKQQDNISNELEATHNTGNSTSRRRSSTSPTSRSFYQVWDMTPVIEPIYCGWRSTWQIQTSPIVNGDIENEVRKHTLFKSEEKPESLDWKEREFLTDSFQRQSAENDHIEYGPDQTVRVVLIALRAEELCSPGPPETTIQRRQLKVFVRVEQTDRKQICAGQASRHQQPAPYILPSQVRYRQAPRPLSPTSQRQMEKGLGKYLSKIWEDIQTQASQKKDTATTEETKRPFFSEENLKMVDELLAKYTVP
ncbi:MAG: hypothetical protein Q9222_007131 [Ikaeria aurantiellina]